MSNAAVLLTDVNRLIAAELRARGDPLTASRIEQCRHGQRPSHCKQVYCATCTRYGRHQRHHVAAKHLHAVKQGYPGATPVFLSTTTADCEPGQVRDQIKAIRRGWQRLYRPCGRRTPLLGRKTLAAEGTIEAVPSAEDPALVNVHSHSLLLMADGYPFTGRDRIPQNNSDWWQDQWSEAMGPDARSAHAVIAEDWEIPLVYSYKLSNTVVTPSGEVKQPAYVLPHSHKPLPAARIVEMQDAQRGLSLYLSR